MLKFPVQKKQLESGVLLYDIQCRTDKILIILDGIRAACVFFITAEKLSQLGWLVTEPAIVEPVESTTPTELAEPETTEPRKPLPSYVTIQEIPKYENPEGW